MRRFDDRTLERLRRAADWPELGTPRFEIVEELGRGGMGAVFRVRDRTLGRDVALKVLAVEGGDLADRLAAEARILASLEHPGVVPIHDVGTLADGRPYYLMKLVDGERLDVFAETAPLAERLRVLERVCETVAFAHARGVAHRDLKPSNVMVASFGEVLVLDWGIAAAVGTGDERRAAGTPGFVAPEQASGAAADARADVYSLGALLDALVDAPVPPALVAIRDRAMAAEPADRYASATELGRELARYLTGARVEAHRERLLERAARIYSAYRVPILLVLAYLVMRILLVLFARI